MILGVDVGGTFTDAVLLTGERLVTAKAPTTPDDQSEGVLAAVRRGARGGRRARPRDVERFVHGMTVGTNALLEGERGAHRAARHRGLHRPRGARAARRAPSSTGSAPATRRRSCPPSCAWPCPSAPAPTACCASSTRTALRASARRSSTCEAVAVCLLWGFRHPEHERRAAELAARGLPRRARLDLARDRRACSASTSAAPPRSSTPPSPPCCAATSSGWPSARATRACPQPEVMLSSGGVGERGHRGPPRLVDRAVGPGRRRRRARPAWPRWRRRRCRGPGHGRHLLRRVGGARRAASRWAAGARWAAGRWRCRWSTCTRSGAGGGSIAWRDAGGALRVGPRSAGADPGPACYGRGGERPTVTDANLLLGYLDAGSPLAGGVRARPRRGRAGGGGAGASELGLSLDEAGRGDRARGRQPRWRRRCAWSRSSAGSTRATWRWSPSAAPGRCTPRRSPTSWG